jgi:hypothetical protein
VEEPAKGKESEEIQCVFGRMFNESRNTAGLHWENRNTGCEMPKSKTDVAALKRDIETFFKRHGLATFAWQEGSDLTEEQIANGGEKTYFRMGFDEEIYHVFWPLPDIDAKQMMRYRSVRKTFDDIVAKHRFRTEFEEYYRLCFMSLEPSTVKVDKGAEARRAR